MFSMFKRKNKGFNFSKEEPKMVISEENSEVSNTNARLVNTLGEMKSENFENKDSEPRKIEIKFEDEIKTNKLSISSNDKEKECESQVGKLIICVSDLVENPIVAVGVDVVHLNKNKFPMLSAYDIVKKEKFIPLGIIFDYTEQKFDALNKMDANERIALFFNRLGSEIIGEKPIDSKILYSTDVWKTKVLEAIDKINRGEWT